MKAGIHPEYHETDMVCACGAVYHTRSTRRDIRIGICAACHPFFTGEQKFVDTAGRVEKFAKRYGFSAAVTLGEFLNAAGGIDKFLFAGEKRVAGSAYTDSNVTPGRAGVVDRPARAHHVGLVIFWVNACFHVRK